MLLLQYIFSHEWSDVDLHLVAGCRPEQDCPRKSHDSVHPLRNSWSSAKRFRDFAWIVVDLFCISEARA